MPRENLERIRFPVRVIPRSFPPSAMIASDILYFPLRLPPGYIHNQSAQTQRNQQRRTARRKKRERDSGRREKSYDDPAVHQRLQKNDERTAEAEIAPEPVGTTEADPEPANRENDEQREKYEHAEKAHFLAPHGEDEVRLNLGNARDFPDAVAKPSAPEPAGAERVERCVHLIARPRGSCSGWRNERTRATRYSFDMTMITSRGRSTIPSLTNQSGFTPAI